MEQEAGMSSQVRKRMRDKMVHREKEGRKMEGQQNQMRMKAGNRLTSAAGE